MVLKFGPSKSILHEEQIYNHLLNSNCSVAPLCFGAFTFDTSVAEHMFGQEDVAALALEEAMPVTDL